MKLRLSNIQRFCVHDGPGIRTTVFLKGCSIRCPWCANPESLSYDFDYYLDKNKCIKEGNVCTVSETCNCIYGKPLTIDDYKECRIHAIGRYGYELTSLELANEIRKDEGFYSTDGGVTFSGGEALLQIEGIEETLGFLKGSGISSCIETSLYSPKTKLEKAVKLFDWFYVDIKILDQILAKKCLNADSKIFYENMHYLFSQRERECVTVRIPLVKGYTLTEGNLLEVFRLIKEYKPGHCELFSVHNLGKKKYDTMNMSYKDFDKVETDVLVEIMHKIQDMGIEVTINTI